MTKIGALVVGIGTYKYGLRRPHRDLAYPKADADGIQGYVETCWPDGHVLRIPEDDATLANIACGFAELATGGPYDLQLIFLSGHGIVEPPQRGFLVQPNDSQQSLSLLDPNKLDSFLDASKAERTILILDCCYAEAILGQLRFFSALDSDCARLCIGSSRATQQTWEDARVKHGIFTAHLLDLLRTGSSSKLSSVKDSLDVDGELFPILCSQVPLYVLEHKGEKQEPVKGGLAAASITLPVARAQRRIAERTPLATAFRRVRQIGVGLAATAACLLAIAYMMLYHIEPGQSGTLVVRHGTRSLGPIFRYVSQDWVDTGIPASELSDNPVVSHPLLTGTNTGVWSHGSMGQYRSWYDSVSAGLEANAAKRYNILVGVGGPPPAAQLGDNPRPSEVAFAAWAALAQGRPQDLDIILQQLPGSGRLVSLAVSTFDPNYMDFTVLDQTVDGMQNFALAISYASALDPVRATPAYIGFAKAASEWLAHNSDAHRGRDAQARVRIAVADCLSVIARARLDRGFEAIDPATIALFESLSREGHADLINSALSRVSVMPEARTSAVRQLSDFLGDPGVPAQRAALESIIGSLDHTPQSRSTVDEAAAKFRNAGNGESSDLSRLLIAAADADALSPDLVNQLVTDAKNSLAKSDRDFVDADRARVIAHAMRRVPATDRASVYELIDVVTNDVAPMSMMTAEIYAALGRQKLDRPGMLEHVSAQAKLAKPHRPGGSDASKEVSPGLTILVGPGPWVDALAQFGQNRPLPDADVAVLREHSADPFLRRTATRALVEQERLRRPDASTELWTDHLFKSRTARERTMWENMISEALASIPRQDFLAAMESIRTNRARQREPEIRISFGTILAEAPMLRVGRPQNLVGDQR